MQRSTRVKKRYIHGFDGLRALGVIAVISYHLNPAVFRGGYLGVPVFMVLSGYLITDHLLLDLKQKQHYDFKGFWLRRLKRLYPTLITMLMATAAYIVLFQRALLENLQRIVLSNLFYLYNWWQVFDHQSYFERFANNESPFTHLWTLSIEGQFYLVWPLIVMLIWRFSKKNKRRNVLLTSLGLALLSAALMTILFRPDVDPSRVYYGTDTRAFSILLGCALAVVWPSGSLRSKLARTDRITIDLVGLAGFAGMIWLTLALDDHSTWLYRGGMLLFSLFTVLLVAVVAHPGADWDRLLTNPVFKWLGSRSYGIYLYQFPVMIFFESHFRNIADHPFLYPLIEVSLILVISEVSYRFVERPLARFDYRQTWSWCRRLFQKNQGRRLIKQRITAACLSLIVIIGLVGVIQAPRVQANTANHSQLAQTIKRNTLATKKENAKIAAQARSDAAERRKAASDKSLSRSLSIAASKSSAAAEAEAAKNPVNQDLEKYGLTQVELHAAQNLQLTGVGDSVMLGSAEGYKRIFPKMYLDAAISQQVYSIQPKLQELLDQGVVAPVVLIGLGTNGSFYNSDLDGIMHQLGPHRTVFWINVHVPTRPWQNQVNSDLEAGAKRFSNLHIVDWYDFSKNHQAWFASDDVHPNPTGSPYYYSFVAKQILTTLAAENADK
ncbi:acyltransferase family protein [Lapidilactobacillus luobeiensis]|uniref:acyltransferase family protein n=1 Tax=Lapidilactobacillus luobeiensis TaxID=2950371 RepID=UPI0021C38808|nr:acyltransferase family protein [Lapidilactobacillus luobeiensis]